MIYWLYERMLMKRLRDYPHCISFMITEHDMLDAPDKIAEVVKWCSELPVERLTFHISTEDPDHLRRCVPYLRAIGTHAKLYLYFGDEVEITGSGKDVVVAVGRSGREEITECIRKMAEKRIDPERVDENLIESYLTFKYEPDLVIKTGGDHLTDFLIWQSVYSELFFLDVNWALLRKVDFLRALRDYESRARRFGK